MDFFHSLQGQRSSKVQPKSKESATETASSRMYQVPLEEIFGSPEEQTMFREHRRITQDAEDEPGYTTEMCRQPARLFRGTSASYCEVPIDDLSPTESSVTVPIIEQTQILPERAEVSPTLQFSIFHDIQRSTLTIYLLGAHLLATSPKDSRDQCVFVCLYLHWNRENIFESRILIRLRGITGSTLLWRWKKVRVTAACSFLPLVTFILAYGPKCLVHSS